MEEPVRLSKEAVREVHAQPEKRQRFVVQFIAASANTVREKTVHIARISDGTFSASVVVYPQIADQFALLAPFDVIEAALTKRDAASNYIILYELRLLYSGLTAAIGRPIEYRVGAENPLGDETIPIAAARLSAPRREVPRAAIGEHYTAVAALNIYDRRWTIRCRVVRKSEVKRFKSGGRDGCVFNAVLRDESAAIQSSFFGEAAERFHKTLVEGAVYAFSDGEVRNAGRFNATENRYEIVFGEKANVREVADAPAIAAFHFKFATIAELQSKTDTEIFDLIAVVEERGELKEIALRDGTLSEKRVLTLFDCSELRIEAIFWGELARNAAFEPKTVIVLQNVRVRDYNGSKTVICSMGTRIVSEVPNCAEFEAISRFRDARVGGNLRSLSEHGGSDRQTLSKLSQIAESAEALLATGEQSKLYFAANVFALRIVGNLFYDSCPNDNCMKKLISGTFSAFFCEKCHKSYERSKPRFMCVVKLADDSGNLLAIFSGDEHAQTLFGCSAARLSELRDADEIAYNEFVGDCLFGEYNVRLLAKREFFNGEAKIKYQTIRLSPISNAIDGAAAALLQSVLQIERQ